MDNQNIEKFILKLFMSFVIYFAIINTLAFFQSGFIFTPREWLIHPILNLYKGDYIIGWLFLGMSLFAGFTLFDIKQKEENGDKNAFRRR